MIKKIVEKTKQAWNWFKQASLMKKGLVILGLFLLIWGGNKLFAGGEGISYQTEKVKTGTIVKTVSETGEILNSNKTEVMSTAKGIVTEIYIDNGDEVKKGEPLFKVEGTATEEERMDAYASYLTAKNSLALAEATYYTLQASAFSANSQFINDAVARELGETDPTYIQQNATWLGAEAKYNNQADVITAAKVSMSGAWLAYEGMVGGVVKATANGEVANLSVFVGEQVNTTNTALVVKSGGDMWVKLALSESDILELKSGQLARIEADALNETFDGKVERVDEIGTVDSGVVTYYVYLSMGEVSEMLRPGMTVQADIEVAKKEGILMVSSAAIKTYQGSQAVQVMRKDLDEPIYVPVEVGIEGDTMVEIVKGLKEGDVVVLNSGVTETNVKSGGGGGGGIMGVMR